MADGHNISDVTKKLFAVHGRHSLLWPKATALKKSQAVYDLVVESGVRVDGFDVTRCRTFTFAREILSEMCYLTAVVIIHICFYELQ